MRSKEIGNSRQTEKRLLRDMEVFSSPQFLTDWKRNYR